MRGPQPRAPQPRGLPLMITFLLLLIVFIVMVALTAIIATIESSDGQAVVRKLRAQRPLIVPSTEG